MQQYWGDTEEQSDSQIEEAANDYAKLVFTNPAEERGLSIDWAQKWLKRVGIEEHNPITLFQISHMWKTDHLCNVNIISSMRVVGAKDSEPQPKPQPAAQRPWPKLSPRTAESLSNHSVSDPRLVTSLTFPRRDRSERKSPQEIVQKDLPEEKLEEFLKLARHLIREGVDTPEKLASNIPENAWSYAQALWDSLAIVNPKLRGTHDWQKIFGGAP